tara:strand:+ start:418 stop:645 length:228 start_codon:yes stop_codon:yes gene_type:complete
LHHNQPIIFKVDFTYLLQLHFWKPLSLFSAFDRVFQLLVYLLVDSLSEFVGKKRGNIDLFEERLSKENKKSYLLD